MATINKSLPIMLTKLTNDSWIVSQTSMFAPPGSTNTVNNVAAFTNVRDMLDALSAELTVVDLPDDMFEWHDPSNEKLPLDRPVVIREHNGYKQWREA